MRGKLAKTGLVLVPLASLVATGPGPEPEAAGPQIVTAAASGAGQATEKTESPVTPASEAGAGQQEVEVSRRVMAALAKIKAGAVRPSNRSVGASLEVVQVAPGRNETITVAGDHLNRIVTPFENPVAHTVDKAKVKVDGNSLYVSLGKDDGPAALFITEDGQQDPSISLTLMPREVAPREVRLKLNGNWPVAVGGGGAPVLSGGKAARWEKSLPYEAAIEEVWQCFLWAGLRGPGDLPPERHFRVFGPRVGVESGISKARKRTFRTFTSCSAQELIAVLKTSTIQIISGIFLI